MTRRRKVLWGAVIAAFVLSVLSVTNENGFRRYVRLRNDVDSLSSRNRQLRQMNAAMAREIEALRSDPRATARAAREELGFIRPGEVVFNVE